MDVIYGLIPGMLLLGLLGVIAFFWAARSGQFDDMEGEANRILMDDDLRPQKPSETKKSSEAEEVKAKGES
ncbi:MAG: cbb3-type cytochrome oxidase assembly protein CcoS [Candidatus Sedimenticola sp. (ex Thyasira tokunagai)]